MPPKHPHKPTRTAQSAHPQQHHLTPCLQTHTPLRLQLPQITITPALHTMAHQHRPIRSVGVLRLRPRLRWQPPLQHNNDIRLQVGTSTNGSTIWNGERRREVRMRQCCSLRSEIIPCRCVCDSVCVRVLIKNCLVFPLTLLFPYICFSFFSSTATGCFRGTIGRRGTSSCKYS